MKEEEAKTKWCPQVRLSEHKKGVFFSAFNRFFGVFDNVEPMPRDCNCIASDCMMWVWDKTQEEVFRDNAQGQTLTGSFGDHQPNSPQGHCGLINK